MEEMVKGLMGGQCGMDVALMKLSSWIFQGFMLWHLSVKTS